MSVNQNGRLVIRARGVDRDGHNLVIARPVVEVVPAGKNMALWIGNNTTTNKDCYAYLSGPVALRKLARAILAEVGEE